MTPQPTTERDYGPFLRKNKDQRLLGAIDVNYQLADLMPIALRRLGLQDATGG
jgi:hypothetical protein